MYLLGLEPRPQLSTSPSLILLLKVVVDIYNLVFLHDTGTYNAKQFVISAISDACNVVDYIHTSIAAEKSVVGVSAEPISFSGFIWFSQLFSRFSLLA